MSERGFPWASYTFAFKLRVLGYAVEHGNRAAGKKFAVDESCISKCQIPRAKLTRTPKFKRANRSGVPAFPDLEKELVCWMKEKHQGGFRVSTNFILFKAKQISEQSGMQEGKFRASKSCCYGFIEQHRLSIRHDTTMALRSLQRTTRTSWSVADCYWQEKAAWLSTETYWKCRLDAFDISGVKNVPILAIGHDKDRFTGMLACLEDEIKLLQYVVFNGKHYQRKWLFPMGMESDVKKKDGLMKN